MKCEKPVGEAGQTATNAEQRARPEKGKQVRYQHQKSYSQIITHWSHNIKNLDHKTDNNNLRKYFSKSVLLNNLGTIITNA